MGACCWQGLGSCVNISTIGQCVDGWSGTPWPNADDYDSYDCDSTINGCEACDFTCWSGGACCIEDHDCEQMTPDNCNNAGGLYWGNDTTCDVDRCTGTDDAYLGACCCQWCSGYSCNPCGQDGVDLCENDMNYADCWSRGDDTFNETVWHHGEDCCSTPSGTSLCCPDFDCDTTGFCQSECNECPGSNVGYCCYIDPEGNDDSCVENVTVNECEDNCAPSNACTWIDTNCNDCDSVERGACCYTNGDCDYRTEDNCGSNGGTYVGNDTVCDSQCNIGACCGSNSTCSDNIFRFQCNYYTDTGYGFYEGDPCDQQCNIGACCSYLRSGPNCADGLDGTDSYIMDECEEGYSGIFHDLVMCSELSEDSDCFQQPTGACCLNQDPWCYPNMIDIDCVAAGGNWQGVDSSCAVNCNDGSEIVCCYPGELPNGTMHNCFACFMVDTEETCVDVYSGTPGEDLDIFTCEDGACCFEGDPQYCMSQSFENCHKFGGTPIGPEVGCPSCATDGDCSGCGADGCEICMGSCCYTNNSTPICETTTLPDCADISGGVYTFGNFGTNCDDNPCPASGACCHLLQGSGTCVDGINEWDCQEALDFFYSGQDCLDIECDNPTDGSCCLGGTCYSPYIQSNCSNNGGVYYTGVDDCDGIVCDNDKCCKSISGVVTCTDWVDYTCNCLDDGGDIIPDCIAQGMINCDDCGDDIAFACCSRVDGLFTGNCMDALFCDGDDLLIPNKYCSDNPCVLGACCYYDENTDEDICLMTVDYDCGIKDGTFHLNGDCVECYEQDDVIGACCIEYSPGCLEVTQSVCDGINGDWTEEETCQENNSCTENNWGACCRYFENIPICSEESSFNCESLEGDFYYHEECSGEICQFVSGDDCVVCSGMPGCMGGAGCPDGLSCCQPENICMESCDSCYCPQAGRECCPDGSCNFPCSNQPPGCGLGPPCPPPLDCCPGITEPPAADDFYCAYPCDNTPELILCCTAPNGGIGNAPCETDNTTDTHECVVKTPEECIAGGGAIVADCGMCHDVCCPIICCTCLIGGGCVYPGGDCESEAGGCWRTVTGYSHDGNCPADGECGDCSCEPCASSTLQCGGSCPTEDCDCCCKECTFSIAGSVCNDCGDGNDQPCDCCCCCPPEGGGDACDADPPECYGWMDPSHSCDCSNGPECNTTSYREISPPNLGDTHTNVQLPGGECVWMECVGADCPYPVCREDL